MKSWSLLLLLLGLLSVPAHAGSLYTESVQGDLSNAGATPTSLGFSQGSNELYGTTGRDLLTGVDRDYFTFVVPIGSLWTGLQVQPGTSPGGSFSFIGIEFNNQVTVPPSAIDATGLLGWTHYSDAEIGVDLLPIMGVPNLGSTGFATPLPAGTYAIWIQDLQIGTFAYGFDFVLTAAAPEPPVTALVALALAAGILSRRTMSRRILRG